MRRAADLLHPDRPDLPCWRDPGARPAWAAYLLRAGVPARSRRRGHGRPPGMVADRSAGPTAGLPAQPRLHDAGASLPGSDPPGPAWHRGLCPGELDAIHPEHSGMEPAGVRCLSRLLHRAVPPTYLMRAVAWSFVSSRVSAVSIWRKPERMRDTDQTSV
nr:hypothetical 17.3K protein - Pseudomonas aeruginosa [Pseudomonas aeruginosa]